MKRRLLYLIATAALMALSIAPVASGAVANKAPVGVWSGPGDQEGDLSIFVISNGGIQKQPAMYLEKIAGACGMGPAVFYDPDLGVDGNALHIDGVPFLCADTGQVPIEQFSLGFEYHPEDDTIRMVDEVGAYLITMERQCEEPAAGDGEVINGTPGDDILLGTDGDDEIDGKGGIDILCGFGGKDHLTGGGDHDVLLGGTQKDDLRGKRGVDYLDGGPHKDKLYGNADNDFLHGDAHDDKIRGGAGDDVAHGGKHKEGDTCEAETETKCELDF